MPEDLKKETDRKKGQNTNKNNLYLRKQTVRKRERDKNRCCEQKKKKKKQIDRSSFDWFIVNKRH
jgi:hypothetical protein